VIKEINKFEDKDPRRVFLGGFSQGCLVALAAFLKLPKDTPLGGVFGLSGLQALRAAPRLTEERLRVLRRTPLFLYHGEDDGVCPLSNTMLTYDYFKGNIYTKEFKENLTITYEPGLPHALSDVEERLLVEWLKPKLNNDYLNPPKKEKKKEETGGEKKAAEGK